MVVVDVDTVAVCSVGTVAQVDWLGPKVGGYVSLFCIHQITLVNSHNGCAMVTAPSTLL